MDETHNQGAQQSPAQRAIPPRRLRPVWIVIFLVIVALIVVAGIVPRLRTRAQVRSETAQLAVPYVAVAHPRRQDASNEIILPANIQAYTDSPIYARTNGYLKKWYVDIGGHVTKGELLAEIETPEVDQQLSQARADQATAQANLDLAKITADRYEGLLKTDSVSKQDADNAEGDFEAKRAALASAAANVKRLQDLQSFENIYAPFDGVITARNVDIGDLIDAGASGGTHTELFHIAFTRVLRVYVSIPQADSAGAKPGIKAELALPEFPGRLFPGKLVSTAQAIDPSSRTLLAEISVENPTGELLPGAYAEVHLAIPSVAPTFVVPVSALLFRADGLHVVTVENGDRAVLIDVTLGRDFGNETEILSGLTGDEWVVLNPPDSIVTGAPVRVADAGSSQQGAGQ
ncbi:MAG: efflux RND transporter periplasmic adaptor subunit [Candidatus Acidiferrales bacterium]